MKQWSISPYRGLVEVVVLKNNELNAYPKQMPQTYRLSSTFHFMVWLKEEDSTIGDDPSLVAQFYFRDETPPFPEAPNQMYS